MLGAATHGNLRFSRVSTCRSDRRAYKSMMARRESRQARAARTEAIFERLAAANPTPKGELQYINPFTLLVAVVLSAQATDSGVNKATPALFAIWPLGLSIVAIAFIEVPSAVVLSRAVGIEGVWVAYPICFCTMFILQMSYYLLVWRKRRVRRLI